MTDQITVVDNYVETYVNLGVSHSSYNQTSFLGLPGQGHVGQYLGINWLITAWINDELEVMLKFEGDPDNYYSAFYTDSIFRSSTYPTQLYVSPGNFTLTASASGINISNHSEYVYPIASFEIKADRTYDSNGTVTTYARYDGINRVPFDQPFDYVVGSDSITVNAGDFDQFYFGEEDLTGYIYVAGCAYYSSITSPISVSALRIALPNLKRLLYYYPGEIAKSNSWDSAVSCNRSGGYFQKLQNRVWVDRKNKYKDASESTVFIYKDDQGNKGIAPRIGNTQ